MKVHQILESETFSMTLGVAIIGGGICFSSERHHQLTVILTL